jgi:Amt family ammonium transporter
LIGIIASICCFFAITLKIQLGIDDSLDTFPVHGVGGTVGAILTGVFATTTVNSAGKDGLIAGNPFQLFIQLGGVGIAIVFSCLGTYIILKIVDAIWGLRLKPGDELQGLDISEHGEEAYGEEFPTRGSTTLF